MSNMSKNILVVEDEPASLECISHFLRKEGYRVSEARDGAEAIELLDNSRFDLVLTDIRMPRLDGVALAMHILSRLPTVPIITMTAFPSEDLRPIWGYGIQPGFRSRECHGEEFWGKVGGRSTIGVMILSGWVGVWSVTDHSNCAAIGIPCETVRNRRTNSERS